MDHDHVLINYREYVLENGHAPPSVYAFAKSIEIGEREFFEAFASFEALEAGIWRKAVTDTIDGIQQGEEWSGFSAHQKLLTFHYAFCDRILDQRSFFLARFPRGSKGELPSRSLLPMREAFVTFARKLVAEGEEREEIACRGPLSKTYPEALFGHFLTVIEFNLADSSSKFERTDAYIEKSVRLAFDVIGTQALDSALDLVRFFSASFTQPSS